MDAALPVWTSHSQSISEWVSAPLFWQAWASWQLGRLHSHCENVGVGMWVLLFQFGFQSLNKFMGGCSRRSFALAGLDVSRPISEVAVLQSKLLRVGIWIMPWQFGLQPSAIKQISDWVCTAWVWEFQLLPHSTVRSWWWVRGSCFAALDFIHCINLKMGFRFLALVSFCHSITLNLAMCNLFPASQHLQSENMGLHACI